MDFNLTNLTVVGITGAGNSDIVSVAPIAEGTVCDARHLVLTNASAALAGSGTGFSKGEAVKPSFTFSQTR